MKPLRQPSENIRALEELIIKRAVGRVSYSGGACGVPLYKDKDAAVQRLFLPAGAKFETHVHPVTEVIIVLEGRLQSTSPLITAVTEVAGVIVYPPNIPHSHQAEADCVFLGILVPCNGGYPDVK